MITDTDMTILYVKWDGERTVEVRLPTYLYMGKVCGLCGDFDGNSTNEFQTPEGQQVRTAVGFIIQSVIPKTVSLLLSVQSTSCGSV